MKITKIKIENFKSIKEIEFNIENYAGSYTRMFLGINESGKSNILEAMSFMTVPSGKFDYDVIHNQKDEENDPVDLWFHLAFEDKKTYLDEVRKKIKNGDLLNFELDNIVKNVYIQHGGDEFEENIEFELTKINNGIFIRKTQNETTNSKGEVEMVDIFELNKEKGIEEGFEGLSAELFKKYFKDQIVEMIRRHEPSVSFWKPSEKFLISEVDLSTFGEETDSNIPLRNIFRIAGFMDDESIKAEIGKIANTSLRRRLAGTLGSETTKYIKDRWNHNILIDIEITDGGICNVSVRDEGKKNEYNYHKMNVRSEGFKQFISLILSLSVEAKKDKNKLILIDEPEAHLHPSGVRDLREELLEIGKNNYLFVSTHSPFLVDRKNIERNIVIKKNNSALTEKKEIKDYQDIRSDEVLAEAFGLNVFKDLINPLSILVEGSSDKNILEKTFKLQGYKFGITNGTGSNIVSTASLLNRSEISILVVVDDDESGKKYKEAILKIEGVYNKKNVLTIRDLVPEIINEGTIEDVLGIDFIKSKFGEFYKDEFGEDSTLVLTDDPFVQQIKSFLQKNDKFTEGILDRFKKKISEDFNPNGSFEKKFPMLQRLVVEINNILSN